MFGGQKKPFTAVTQYIERLTAETYDEEDFTGIPDLIEVIRLQSTGPAEASRAIRKKLKYGNIHRQLRALTILDALIGNAGTRFQKGFADEMLLERLRLAASDPVTDPEVKKKLQTLFAQWSVGYKNTQGLQGIAGLYKQLPQRKQTTRPSAKILNETPAEEPESAEVSRDTAASSSSGRSRGQGNPISLGTGGDFGTSNPVSKSSKVSKKSKDGKKKPEPFNLEKEKPLMMQNIAASSVASTNLLNALKLINREKERVGDNEECRKRFETCKQLRRQILRYIQHVESEQWLGGLIHANEELVNALMMFDALDKPIEEDSDSEDEWNNASDGEESDTEDVRRGMQKTRINQGAPQKPPRPNSIGIPPSGFGKQKVPEPEPEEDDDPDNPFGDSNVVDTPAVEKGPVTWKVV